MLVLMVISSDGRLPGHCMQYNRKLQSPSHRLARALYKQVLNLPHYCDKTRGGRFTVKKKTQAKRMIRKLKALRSEMKERLHLPVSEQHQWLCQVLKGHYGYYGVIFNYRSMERFRHLVSKLWLHALRRQSQKAKRTWEWFEQLLTVFPLPKPVIHQRWFGARA